jgi:thioredoxin reductase (NADPH)
MSELENVVIVGSGPAGWTAALYTSRANLRPLLFEGSILPDRPDLLPGGQLMLTTDVENYPGYPEGVSGQKMMEDFKQQAVRFGTRVEPKSIGRVDFSTRPFRLWSDDGEIRARAVILATGASARWLGLESETKLRNRGVSACATCDGALYRGVEHVVVGGGDSAMEEATFLTRFATKVTVVHRRDTLRASKIMQERAMKNPKIAFIWDSAVEEVLDVAAGRVTGVKLKNLKTDERAIHPCGALFVAIGHEPNTAIFQGQVELDAKGYIKVKPNTSHTNVPGVFACGDAMDARYRQAVTAAGTGCMAAIDAERWLETQEA